MPRISLTAIDKSYGANKVLSSVDLTLEAGRIHAIVGENGAGKSTLLKIAAGFVGADAGAIVVDGERVARLDGAAAIARGIGMVHQHFVLVPTLTALQNVALGREPTRFGIVDLRGLRASIEALCARLDLHVRLDAQVEDLSVGERQRLEIVRVLHRGARVLILDEPTAVLAPAEAKRVLELARRLANEGTAVALVTHHLDEVVAHADEVTVLRAGVRVAHHGVGDPACKDARALAREALGEIADVKRTAAATGPTILRLLNVRSIGDDLSVDRFDLKAREIVGVAGVEGNGQAALEALLAATAPRGHGTIEIGGRDASDDDPHARRSRGVAIIPSDRHRDAIADALPAGDVVRLGAFDEVTKSGGRAWIDDDAIRAAFSEAVNDFEVRPNDADAIVASFSGGNQQKLVVARELRRRPDGALKIVVAAQPTRGVDARVAARIQRALVDAARVRGAAVIVVSSDLSELRTIADRIVVLRGGRFVAELPPTASVDALGAAMLGDAMLGDAREESTS